jgi:hypothetical protein
MRWAGIVECLDEKRWIYRVLGGKSKGMKLHGQPRHRWEDYISIYFLKKQVWKTWIGFISLRILTTVRDVCVAVIYCRFYKMQRTFSVVDAHLAPEDGLFFV